MLTNNTHKRNTVIHRLLFILVILLAAFLRFYRLDWVEYKLDEANISRLALDMVRHGRVPVWGLGSSVGIYNGALPVWLLAIPYAVSSSPLVATGFVAALNVLAVAMTWAFTRRLAGPKAALIAAALLAVAPWAVLNSRKLWAQDLLPPFVIAYGWSAHLAFIEKKSWWLVVHALALAACIQLHYSALTLVFLSAFCVPVFGWRRWPWRVLLVTLLMGLLALAPFLYLDAITITPDPVSGQMHAFPNLTRIVQTALGRQATTDATAFQMAWLMMTGHDLHSLAGPHEFRNFLNSLLPVNGLFTLLGALVVVALGWALWRAARARRDSQARAGLLIAMGILVPVLLFMRHSTPVYPHYFILLYPWPYVLVGMLIAWLADKYPRWRADWLGGAMVAVIAAAQIYGYLSILHFVAGRNTPGGYGTPLGLTLRAVRAAEQMAHQVDGDIVIVASHVPENADEIAAIWDVLVEPAFAPRTVRGQAMLYPASPTIYVYAAPRNYPAALVMKGAILPLRAGESYYVISKDMFARPGAGNLSWVGPDRWANGVQLLSALGYGDLRPGGTCILETVWRVASLPPADADYHWFHHLLDAAGRRVGQMDGVGFPSSSWRVGDQVSTEFFIPIAADAVPGLYTIRVGMYTFPDIQNVLVVDAAGQPVSDAIEIGPIKIE